MWLVFCACSALDICSIYLVTAFGQRAQVQKEDVAQHGKALVHVPFLSGCTS